MDEGSFNAPGELYPEIEKVAVLNSCVAQADE